MLPENSSTENMQASPNKQSTANQGSENPLTGHRTALSMLVLAYTLSITDRMILSILFPDIKAEFGISDTQLGLLGAKPVNERNTAAMRTAAQIRESDRRSMG